MSNQASSSIYVGDLDPEVTETSLFEIFNAVGPVSSVKVCLNPQTQKSLGYGYVNFHKASDAERAIDTMNFASIKGRPCRIMWSIRDKTVRDNGVGNIVIKNLDTSIDNKTLYDTFSMFGDILSCKVGTNSEGESLGYGFVHYVNPASAKKAIEKINGMLIAEKKVTVEPYMKLEERASKSETTFTNVYIKNVPSEWTEETLKAKLAGFGETTSVLIPKTESGDLKGYCFANFASHEAAQLCVDGVEDGMIAARALSKAELKNQARLNAKSAKSKNLNLYVKNLAEAIDEESLTQIFEEYGKTTSVRIMLDSSGKSKGFGFVCFEEESSASKAMAELNGKDVEGKEIYVGLAQTKAERQAFLSKKYAMSQKASPSTFRPPFPGFPSAYAVPMRAGYPAYPSMGYPPPYPGMSPSLRNPAPLSTANLMGKTNTDVKQILGEKLYQQIQQVEPQKAGKITGMLLEMDQTEILHLLDSREALLGKVNDALLVLQHAGSQ